MYWFHNSWRMLIHIYLWHRLRCKMLSFQILVLVLFRSLDNELILHFDQITFPHFCLVLNSLLRMSFINIVVRVTSKYMEPSSTSFDNWSVGSAFQRQVQFLQVGHLNLCLQRDMIDNDYIDKIDPWHWYSPTHQRPGSLSGLIGFIYKTTTRVQWMIVPTWGSLKNVFFAGLSPKCEVVGAVMVTLHISFLYFLK